MDWLDMIGQRLSGSCHMSPEVVVRVPLWLYESGGGHRNILHHHCEGGLNFNLTIEVHGLGLVLNGVSIEGPKTGGCQQKNIGPELISRAD